MVPASEYFMNLYQIIWTSELQGYAPMIDYMVQIYLFDFHSHSQTPKWFVASDVHGLKRWRLSGSFNWILRPDTGDRQQKCDSLSVTSLLFSFYKRTHISQFMLIAALTKNDVHISISLLCGILMGSSLSCYAISISLGSGGWFPLLDAKRKFPTVFTTRSS